MLDPMAGSRFHVILQKPRLAMPLPLRRWLALRAGPKTFLLNLLPLLLHSPKEPQLMAAMAFMRCIMGAVAAAANIVEEAVVAVAIEVIVEAKVGIVVGVEGIAETEVEEMVSAVVEDEVALEATVAVETDPPLVATDPHDASSQAICRRPMPTPHWWSPCRMPDARRGCASFTGGVIIRC